MGAILTQQQGNPSRLHPCAFFSRKLSPAERNYDIGNRELLAIKLALEEWRHWLEGAKHPFTVLTEHKNLQYLREAKPKHAGHYSSHASISRSPITQVPKTSKLKPYHDFMLLRRKRTHLIPSSKKVQWGKKVFSQPPIVQVLPLKKMREACHFHYRYTSTMRDKIRKNNPENHIVGFFKNLFAIYGGK